MLGRKQQLLIVFPAGTPSRRVRLSGSVILLKGKAWGPTELRSAPGTHASSHCPYG